MPPSIAAAALLGASVHWSRMGTLVLTSLAIMGSPGPATMSLTATGSTFGVRRSLGYLAGICAGTTAVLLAVSTGITAALLAVPGLRPVLLGVATVYIVRLALRLATAPPLARERGAEAPSLGGGALLGVSNPKAWVAIAAVFASAHLAGSAELDAAAKASVLEAMVVLINVTWLFAGASLAPLLRHPSRSRKANVALAVVLVVATAWALFG